MVRPDSSQNSVSASRQFSLARKDWSMVTLLVGSVSQNAPDLLTSTSIPELECASHPVVCHRRCVCETSSSAYTDPQGKIPRLDREVMVDRKNKSIPQTLKAIIFDFDGTLVDSYPAITASVNHVRAAHQLPPLAEPEVRRCVGRGPAYLLEHTVGGTNLDQDMALYRAHHPSFLRSGPHLPPAAPHTP